MMRLGVNIDHIATIREARKAVYPDPVWAVPVIELAGAYGVTVHIRQDRRHIKERDIRIFKDIIKTHLNIEVSLQSDMLDFVSHIRPDSICLVPERKEEVTTEGGLNIITYENLVRDAITELKKSGIDITLFIEPDEKLIRKAGELHPDAVELNTSKYSEATGDELEREIERIKRASQLAVSLSLEVHAGHGLNYRNVKPIAEIPEISELNIGHSIISRAVFVGLERAVREMLELIE